MFRAVARACARARSRADAQTCGRTRARDESAVWTSVRATTPRCWLGTKVELAEDDGTSASAREDSAREQTLRRRHVASMRRALRANDFEGVRRQFEALAASTTKPGRAAWNVNVLAAARAREPEAALSIVESMLADNIGPDVSTHTAVMQAYVRAGRYGDAFNWLKMHLYGVPKDVEEGFDGEDNVEMDTRYDLSHVIGDMIDGDEEHVSKTRVNSMMFTTVMNGAAKAGDRATVQEIETMMFEFDVAPLADTLHCLLKLERVAGTSASVESVWDRSKLKARALKAHQERVVAHAFLGRQRTQRAAESRALAVKALEDLYDRVGRKRSDEDFAKLEKNNHSGSRYARWTGERGLEEYRNNLVSDDDIKKVGTKEVLIATNAVMLAHAAVGDTDTVNTWFVRMEEDLGINADVRTFNAVLRAEYMRDKIKLGVVDHEQAMMRFQEVMLAMEDREVEPTTYTFSTLLLAHAEQSHLPGVAEVLKLMQERGLTLDTTMYNILLGACARAGDLDAALNARASMVKSGIAAGPDTFVPLFAACTKQAEELDLDGDMFELDEEVVGPLLDRTRATLDSVELDMLSSNVEHNTQSFTALVKARGALGQPDAVFDMISELPENIELDEVAIGLSVLAVAKREPTKAIALADSLMDESMVLDPWLLNCIITAYSHLGQIKAATERVQDFIKRGGVPTVATYNALFRCAAQSGSFAEYAPLVMNEMSSRDLKPDKYTRKFIAAVTAGSSVLDRETAEALLKKCPGGAKFFVAEDAAGQDDFDFLADAGFDDDDDDDDDDLLL